MCIRDSHKVAFVMELLTSIPFIKAKLSSKKAKQDTTEYLLSSEANKERLLAAIERSKNGEVVAHTHSGTNTGLCMK